MPNWCENTLTITGKEKELKLFSDKIKKENFLSEFVPLPSDLKETQTPAKPSRNNELLKKKYGTDNWYDWQIKNWGTKWDIEIYADKKLPKKIKLYFDSAWSPPVEAIETISKLYPNLKFKLKYYEGGACYKGIARYKNGLIKDDYKEW